MLFGSTSGRLSAIAGRSGQPLADTRVQDHATASVQELPVSCDGVCATRKGPQWAPLSRLCAVAYAALGTFEFIASASCSGVGNTLGFSANASPRTSFDARPGLASRLTRYPSSHAFLTRLEVVPSSTHLP